MTNQTVEGFDYTVYSYINRSGILCSTKLQRVFFEVQFSFRVVFKKKLKKKEFHLCFDMQNAHPRILLNIFEKHQSWCEFYTIKKYCENHK